MMKTSLLLEMLLPEDGEIMVAVHVQEAIVKLLLERVLANPVMADLAQTSEATNGT